MKRIIARSTIERLNRVARSHMRDGMDVVRALEMAAAEDGLTEIRRDDTTVLYRNKQRAFVNCWLEGPLGRDIGQGAAGFDDQVDWAFAQR